MYVKHPLSLRNVEDLLAERGIDICHETVRFRWNRFGPMFAAEICRKRVDHMRAYTQAILGRGRWDADALRDIVRDYVVETLGADDAVLVIDETGFLKQGKASCGVGRQYTGSAGKLTNCQIGVFAADVSRHGHAIVDRALSLPKA